MGDMIEIKSRPSHRSVFYRMSASGLMFEVKGTVSAAIGLARKPGNSCDIWVVIGHDQRTWIKREDGGGSSVRTPNILHHEEYRRFWLTWRSGIIQLGRINERNPIISNLINMDLCYVTFSSGAEGFADRNLVYWRIEMPPMLEKPQMQSVTNGELVWVHAANHLPEGALIGGHQNESIYIIRAFHEGSLTPGKYLPSKGTGYISWGGESHVKNEFEVLCGFDCIWVPTSNNRIPVGAVEGGYSENAMREKLYVGRALYCGHLITGKVQPTFNACLIPYGGREIPIKKYEILVSLNINASCANKLLMDYIDVGSPPVSESGDDEVREDINFF